MSIKSDKIVYVDIQVDTELIVVIVLINIISVGLKDEAMCLSP